MASKQQSEEEDFALAFAMQMSLYDTESVEKNDFSSQFDEDRALAKAIADSEKDFRDRGRLSSFPVNIEVQQCSKTLEIEGKPALTHQIINGYVDHCTHGCKECRHAMQMARLTVTDAKEEWFRKNMEITVYAEHFSLKFWSGARQNKIVVQVVAGSIEVTVTEESWRAWFQRVVKKSWDIFKNVAIFVIDKGISILTMGPVGAIAGAAFKAIAE
ncbi:uncharacterized protein LOC114535846 [Dendronephthya gigantea]|uniref:uncharacterized protein LOC114535846 n=1 Tax=Dendronephthya gigantea TaxID=151771 RepID=UPI00106B8E68|nr:uncharacterized protein LOC114535846 [Dendronephthya gigantea]